VRLLAAVGLSIPLLRQQVAETRERGGSLQLPADRILAGLSTPEDRWRAGQGAGLTRLHRSRCEAQILTVTAYIEDYFLRRGE
jgi:hypothetical protein